MKKEIFFILFLIFISGCSTENRDVEVVKSVPQGFDVEVVEDIKKTSMMDENHSMEEGLEVS
tara:strand:+ start:576 stop:761 length:186 start_codon:yes stop_codon:yes gene_type:complete